jgi:3-dehydroquinate synthase
MPHGLNPELIIDKMRIDKKAVAGEIRLILWNGIGQAFVATNVDVEVLSRFLQDKTCLQ